MKINIKRYQKGVSQEIEFDYQKRFEKERPMALDVLLQAQEQELPDLAYRYGCRNILCGVCTIEVNGKPKLACRTKVKQGDQLSALKSLPVLCDLVVKRDQVNKPLLGQLPLVQPDPDKVHADQSALHSLNRCIECYACLNKCPSHAQNPINGPYDYGNPYSFLKIQKVLVDPSASPSDKQQAIALAKKLKIDEYDVNKTPGCGVGIDLKKEVLIPLQQECQ